jgi:hypothetical protein
MNGHTTSFDARWAPDADSNACGPRVALPEGAAFTTSAIGTLRHDLDRHRLMQLDCLGALAERLYDTKQCRFIRGRPTTVDEFSHMPRSPDGRGLRQVLDEIETPGSWVALYNIETDPTYRRLLEDIIDSVRNRVEIEQPGIFNIGGFIFVSTPPSVTPFHIDRENNFWLQIRGRKSITVFDHRDRDVVPMPLVEDFIVHRKLDDVRLDPTLIGRGRTFDVGPGEGVYFPATSPHMTETTTDWVRPGNGVSISIGVVFYTARTRHDARVHQFNRILRRVGIRPEPPGRHPMRDAIKAPLGASFAASRARLFGYRPPPGSY